MARERKPQKPEDNLNEPLDAEIIEDAEAVDAEQVEDADVLADDVVLAGDSGSIIDAELVLDADEDVLAAELAGSRDAPLSFPFPQSSSRLEDEVMDHGETFPATDASSSINWNDIDEDEPEAKPARGLEKTVAFDADADVDLGGQHTPTTKPRSGFDPVAEELESGVLRAKEKKPAEPADVNIDDLLADSAESMPTADKLDEDLVESPTEYIQPVYKDDEDVSFDNDIDEPVAVEHSAFAMKSAEDVVEEVDDGDLMKTNLSAEAAKVDDDIVDAVEDDGPEAVAEDEDKPASKKNQKKELATVAESGGRSRTGPLLGGVLVGILLTAGSVAGLWYFAPDMLPDSPNAAPKMKAPMPGPGSQQAAAKPLTPTQTARGNMDEGKYDEAIEALKDAGKDPATLSTLAEARWLKYRRAQAEKKAPPSANDAEVKQALADLKEAKNDLLAEEITQVIAAHDLREQAAKAQESEKALAELKEVVASANMLKQQTEEQLEALKKTLADAKLTDDKGKVDDATVKAITEERANLAKVEKLLADAKVAGGSARGVEAVINQAKENKAQLDEIDKLLAGEKIDPGSKGLRDLVEARNKLTLERDQLEAILRTAYQELSTLKLAPADADPKIAIIDAVRGAGRQALAASSVKQATGTEPGGLPKQTGNNEPPRFAPEGVESTTDPVLAEQHFGRGLHFFWDKNYSGAEKEFTEATRLYSRDARYYYFLGLSQLAQKSSDRQNAASLSIARAVRLEAMNQPTPEETQNSLERVQGELRAMLNQYRTKAMDASVQ